MCSLNLFFINLIHESNSFESNISHLNFIPFHYVLVIVFANGIYFSKVELNTILLDGLKLL